eukprot:2395774-Rhodomonas_salina.1
MPLNGSSDAILSGIRAINGGNADIYGGGAVSEGSPVSSAREGGWAVVADTHSVPGPLLAVILRLLFCSAIFVLLACGVLPAKCARTPLRRPKSGASLFPHICGWSPSSSGLAADADVCRVFSTLNSQLYDAFQSSDAFLGRRPGARRGLRPSGRHWRIHDPEGTIRPKSKAKNRYVRTVCTRGKALCDLISPPRTELLWYSCPALR